VTCWAGSAGWGSGGAGLARGGVEGTVRGCPGGSRAAQPLGGLASVDVEELLELLGGQGTDGQAVALVEGRAELLQVVLVLVGVGVLAHGLLPSASSYRPSRS